MRRIAAGSLVTTVLVLLVARAASADPERASPEKPATPGAAEPEKPNVLEQAIVADLGQHVVGLGYQRVVAPWASLQAAADYYQPWTQNINFLGASGDANKGGDLRGFILRGRVFVHPLGGAPEGLWISPFAQTGIGWARRDGYADRLQGTVWAAGVSVGYTALLVRRLLLGGGLGVQYHSASFPGGSDPPSFSRVYPQVEIQIGYAF